MRSREDRIERYFASADDQQKKRPEPHREIGPRFVHHAEEAVARQIRQSEMPAKGKPVPAIMHVAIEVAEQG